MHLRKLIVDMIPERLKAACYRHPLAAGTLVALAISAAIFGLNWLLSLAHKFLPVVVAGIALFAYMVWLFSDIIRLKSRE